MTYENFQQAVKLDKMINETEERIKLLQPVMSNLTQEDKNLCTVTVGEHSINVHPDCVDFLLAGLLNIEHTFKKSLQENFEAL